MKKLILFAFIVLSFLMFVSCEPENSSVGDETEAETDTDVKDIVVPLPVFGDVDNEKRGLLNLPNEYFKIAVNSSGDYMFASAVMTTMPTMTNLQKGTVSTSGLDGVETDYTVFGFKIKLNGDYSKVNSDGIYLQYTIYEGTDPVGFCDYYYNTETKCFTYRQSVAFTALYELSYGTTTYNDYENRMINLEYKDVYVEDIENPTFKVGQLKDEGHLKLDDNAFVDTLHFSVLPQDTDAKCKFERLFVTANQKKEGEAITMYSFKQLDTAVLSERIDISKFEDFAKILNSLGISDYKVDTEEERKKIDQTFLNQVYPLVYARGESIANHHTSIKGYDNYKDFTADSLRERKQEFTTIFVQASEGSYPEAPCPTIYTYKGTNSTGASTCNQYVGTHTMHFHNLIVSGDTTKKKDDNYKKFGFESYLGKYESTEENDIETFTIKKFLKACGIDNEEYITKLIKENSELEGKCSLNKGTTSSGS